MSVQKTPMEIGDLPTLRVAEIIHDDNRTTIVGSVDRWQWVGERHYAYLYISEKKVIKGRFHDVNKTTMTVKFTPTDSIADIIGVNETYPYFDGYWGERAASSDVMLLSIRKMGQKSWLFALCRCFPN
jgi:hypothetical protein